MPSHNPPGTSSKELYDWEPEDLNEMSTTLAVHQYIQQLVRLNPHDIEKLVTLPDGQDANVWQYEHMRQLCMELNGLVLALEPGCTPEKFPTMYTKSAETTFLCAATNPPRSTDAMTYINNTLDHAIGQLCSSKYFDSRINIPDASAKKLPSLARRLYRIFGHAYFQHREVFNEFEAKTSLCKRFHLLVTRFGIMKADSLDIPDL
eukprot:m.443263 g.443263  ORF g.443263 m.443263 type:complete len:205 (-) comp18946_c0_seq1:1334-1948(-)